MDWDWQLGWYETCADMLDRNDESEAAKEERQKRKKDKVDKKQLKNTGFLPILAG